MAARKGYFSLKWKVSLFIVSGTIILGVTLLFLVITFVSSSLVTELQERGKAIAKSVSDQSQNHIMEDPQTGDPYIKQIVDKAGEFSSVAYIFVVDDKNVVREKTLLGDIPLGLKNANIPPQGANYQIQLLSAPTGDAYDIAAPIAEGQLGHVHVGMRKSYIDEQVGKTRNIILIALGIAIILGTVASFILANRITKPILYLTESADKISMGDFETKIEVTSSDEIGELANAVERMRESLKAAIERLRKRK